MKKFTFTLLAAALVAAVSFASKAEAAPFGPQCPPQAAPGMPMPGAPCCNGPRPGFNAPVPGMMPARPMQPACGAPAPCGPRPMVPGCGMAPRPMGPGMPVAPAAPRPMGPGCGAPLPPCSPRF